MATHSSMLAWRIPWRTTVHGVAKSLRLPFPFISPAFFPFVLQETVSNVLSQEILSIHALRQPSPPEASQPLCKPLFKKIIIIIIILFIYSFIYFWLRWVCIAVPAFSSCGKPRLFSPGVQASHCSDLSCGGWAPGRVGSVVVAPPHRGQLPCGI